MVLVKSSSMGTFLGVISCPPRRVAYLHIKGSGSLLFSLSSFLICRFNDLQSSIKVYLADSETLLPFDSLADLFHLAFLIRLTRR